MSKIIGLTLLFISSLVISCSESNSGPTAEVMYFILIDRFVDGDSTNNRGNQAESYLAYDGTNPEALKHYQGGDLAGIIQSIDSLQALGITMVWISPFIDNSDTDYVGWWPYHGYHPIDFYQVDEHFGTLNDLKSLVRIVHEKGMKIIFDMPFNQTAADHPWVTDQTKQDWYHYDQNGHPFDITDWQDQNQIERGELHGLPDLAQENPAVSKYLLEVSKYWVDETGCDGFRLDAVKHIPRTFWIDYNAAIKAYAGQDFLLFGEVFWGEAERIKPYSDIGFDYLFDIPGYYAIRNTFNTGGSIKDFSNFYDVTSEVLATVSMATLIDNHDVARFNVGLGEMGWQKQHLALGWLMTAPGLPVIYSGTEIGMVGYPVTGADGTPQDYLNRLPFPRVLSAEQTRYQTEFSELTHLRQTYLPFSIGSFAEVYKDWSVYAFLRSWEDQHLLVVLNNAASEEFVAIHKVGGLALGSDKAIYGDNVVRMEGDEWWFRLAPNTLTVWQLDGDLDQPLPVRVDFTDRISGDYQKIRLFYIDATLDPRAFKIAGDFNNWVPTRYSVVRKQDTLFIDLPLKPGSYQYKFVLNETNWVADPHANEFSTDPYGGNNSILNVSGE